MKVKSIERFAHNLAKEISDRPSFDVSEIETLIAVRAQSCMLEFVNEQATNVEKEYQALLIEQSQYRIGTPKYVSTGYKLSALKSKKTLANRAGNNLRSDDKYSHLKDFIYKKFGKYVLDEFHEHMEKMVVQASSSHEILKPI